MWLQKEADAPEKVKAVKGLAENLQLQDKIADAMRENRHEHGALDLETIEAQAVFDGEMLRELRPELPNRAKSLIENLMIAANGVCARFLAGPNQAEIAFRDFRDQPHGR